MDSCSQGNININKTFIISSTPIGTGMINITDMGALLASYVV